MDEDNELNVTETLHTKQKSLTQEDVNDISVVPFTSGNFFAFIAKERLEYTSSAFFSVNKNIWCHATFELDIPQEDGTLTNYRSMSFFGETPELTFIQLLIVNEPGVMQIRVCLGESLYQEGLRVNPDKFRITELMTMNINPEQNALTYDFRVNPDKRLLLQSLVSESESLVTYAILSAYEWLIISNDNHFIPTFNLSQHLKTFFEGHLLIDYEKSNLFEALKTFGASDTCVSTPCVPTPCVSDTCVSDGADPRVGEEADVPV